MAPEIPFKNSSTSKILFFTSVGVLIYWVLGGVVDIYRFAVVGAIYEILWIFMLLAFLVLPLLSLIFWFRERFNIKSFNLYTILVVALNILLLAFIR